MQFVLGQYFLGQTSSTKFIFSSFVRLVLVTVCSYSRCNWGIYNLPRYMSYGKLFFLQRIATGIIIMIIMPWVTYHLESSTKGRCGHWQLMWRGREEQTTNTHSKAKIILGKCMYMSVCHGDKGCQNHVFCHPTSKTLLMGRKWFNWKQCSGLHQVFTMCWICYFGMLAPKRTLKAR